MNQPIEPTQTREDREIIPKHSLSKKKQTKRPHKREQVHQSQRPTPTPQKQRVKRVPPRSPSPANVPN